jgi:hypothetical protein
MSNGNHVYGNNNSDDRDEYGAFLNMMRELRLMIRELMLNPTPILEQPNIVRKLKVLNYALDEWPSRSTLLSNCPSSTRYVLARWTKQSRTRFISLP